MYRLHPATAGRHGVFPNEIYKNILGHVNQSTRNACTHVSRAFYDFATDIFETADGLRAEASCGWVPSWTNSEGDNPGVMKIEYQAFRDSLGQRIETFGMNWIPIVGYANGTAFFETNVNLCFTKEEVETGIKEAQGVDDTSGSEYGTDEDGAHEEDGDVDTSDEMDEDRQGDGYDFLSGEEEENDEVDDNENGDG